MRAFRNQAGSNEMDGWMEQECLGYRLCNALPSAAPRNVPADHCQALPKPFAPSGTVAAFSRASVPRPPEGGAGRFKHNENDHVETLKSAVTTGHIIDAGDSVF